MQFKISSVKRGICKVASNVNIILIKLGFREVLPVFYSRKADVYSWMHSASRLHFAQNPLELCECDTASLLNES